MPNSLHIAPDEQWVLQQYNGNRWLLLLAMHIFYNKPWDFFFLFVVFQFLFLNHLVHTTQAHFSRTIVPCKTNYKIDPTVAVFNSGWYDKREWAKGGQRSLPGRGEVWVITWRMKSCLITCLPRLLPPPSSSPVDCSSEIRLS